MRLVPADKRNATRIQEGKLVFCRVVSGRRSTETAAACSGRTFIDLDLERQPMHLEKNYFS